MIIERASEEKEEVIVASCNLERIDEARTHWPFFRDRRIDSYEQITRRYIDE
jgi:N-carbamoylputrescine amidase